LLGWHKAEIGLELARRLEAAEIAYATKITDEMRSIPRTVRRASTNDAIDQSDNIADIRASS
jgi:hypothetical protein